MVSNTATICALLLVACTVSINAQYYGSYGYPSYSNYYYPSAYSGYSGYSGMSGYYPSSSYSGMSGYYPSSYSGAGLYGGYSGYASSYYPYAYVGKRSVRTADARAAAAKDKS